MGIVSRRSLPREKASPNFRLAPCTLSVLTSVVSCRKVMVNDPASSVHATVCTSNTPGVVRGSSPVGHVPDFHRSRARSKCLATR